MERGDTGPGRDAYGLPRRRRLGDRRAYRPDGGAGPDGPDGAGGDEYGQLLRRPGDPPLSQHGGGQPDRSRMRPPPGRFQPPPASPAGGFPPSGMPRNGGPANAGPMNAGPANAGPMPGGQYRLPNGRRVPPRAARPPRPQAPDAAGGRPGWDQPYRGTQPSGQDPLGGSWGRPRPQAPGGSPPHAGAGPQAYGHVRGPSGTTGASGFAGAAGPGTPGFAAAAGFARSPSGARPDGREGWGRLGAEVPRGVPAGSAGQVIRQRENAVPDEQPASAARAAASIAPDGLDSFARDLRALRARAELDYPEMAELSHYTMKTLVSAAGGLRLPTLPVAVAYVRACGGNVAEWEDRWQKLAARITADAVKKHRGDDERKAVPEPADQLVLPEPPAPPAARDAPAESGEVYVITSAKPPREV